MSAIPGFDRPEFALTTSGTRCEMSEALDTMLERA
jgi:hypothetical protein